MKSVIVLCLLLALASANLNQWRDFKTKYNKSYSDPDQEIYRYSVFNKNLEKAAERQARELPGGAKFGMTKFSDLTEDEFRTQYLLPKDFSATYNPRPSCTIGVDCEAPVTNVTTNPTTWDWFTQGVCTPVYNQGQCGSCWAFSATETIESYNKIDGGKLTQLSMEQIVDCDTTCYGCGGGWPYLAYEYVQSQGGIDTYSSYPYTAEGGNSGTCQYSAANVAARVSAYQTVSGETGLYATLSKTGPVSVCVDASSWSSYQSGVLTQCTNNVDHCVQATGYAQYGQAFPNAYWIVRNSWGTDWGVSGFIYVAIGQDLCSIGDYATTVTA
jgi:C1A family cysteine protease